MTDSCTLAIVIFMLKESDLDRAFANQLASSTGFSKWVLERTKFAHLSDIAVLLQEEQIRAKPNKKPENWWRHWWCRLEDGSESETDIFAVYSNPNTGDRFALHIEDKPPHGKFTPNQFLNYDRRARFMANEPEYLEYGDFTTILLAPESFIQGNREQAEYFDCQITYESVSEFVPEFAQSLLEGAP